MFPNMWGIHASTAAMNIQGYILDYFSSERGMVF